MVSWLSNFLDTAWNIIRTVRLADIADIAIMAFLIYKIISFVMKTSSAKAVRGILFVIAALWLSNVLNLSVISFLLNKTMELGIIAIIILFQPELRKMLDRMGSGRFSDIILSKPHRYGQKIEVAIAQVVLACQAMSKSKTGALIVFERDIRVDDAIKTGTLINADVSSELLQNIFFPKSPLHDGALIIREAQIISAGCMLPMSANQNLSRDLGMRHRAGIGISELSDAMVVIVSEETGSISVAVGGMLKRHLALDTLEKLLRNEFVIEEEPRPGFRTWLRKTLRKTGDRKASKTVSDGSGTAKGTKNAGAEKEAAGIKARKR